MLGIRDVLRWRGARRGDRGSRTPDRPPLGVGHRAVPGVRPSAGRGRARGHRGDAGPSVVAGPSAGPRRRTGDLRRRRGVGPPGAGLVGVVGGATGCPVGGDERGEGATGAPARHDRGAARDADGERPVLRGARRDAGRRPHRVVGPPARIPATASALAVVADYVPFGISQALGRRTSSNDLDAMAPSVCASGDRDRHRSGRINRVAAEQRAVEIFGVRRAQPRAKTSKSSARQSSRQSDRQQEAERAAPLAADRRLSAAPSATASGGSSGKNAAADDGSAVEDERVAPAAAVAPESSVSPNAPGWGAISRKWRAISRSSPDV